MNNELHKKELIINFIKIQTAFTVLTVLWVFFAGKSMSWDVWNHHIYPAFGFSSDRINTDIFPASAQSYQNPLGYLPFYYMVKADWPSWIIGFIFGIFHSLNIGILWIFSIFLWRKNKDVYYWSFFAICLAWISPVFLQVVGTSSIDPITSFFVLTAFLLLILSDRENLLLIISGVLFGFAFSLKQSNVVYGIAGGVVLVLRYLSSRGTLVNIIIFSFSCFCGVFLGSGFWIKILWEKFNNPVFPLYNNIFKSEYFSSGVLVSKRFYPENAVDFFTRILDFSLVKKFVYTESFSPDIRPAVFLFVFAIFICFLFKKTKIINKYNKDDVDFFVFFLFSYICWIFVSGNGRYGIPTFLMFGVLLTRYVFMIFNKSFGFLFLVCVIFSQASVFWIAGDRHMESWEWNSKNYFNVVMPERLREVPFLHLSIGTQTFSSLSILLNQDGALANLGGFVYIDRDNSLSKELKFMLNKWSGNTRVLFKSMRNIKTGEVSIASKNSAREKINAELYRFRLKVDLEDCEYIQAKGAHNFYDFKWVFNENKHDETMIELMSCRVVYFDQINSNFEFQEKVANKVFSVFEKKCQMIYGPSDMATQRNSKALYRYYPNTDKTVFILPSGEVLVGHPRYSDMIKIGIIEDVLNNKVEIPCKMNSLRTPD